MIFAFSQQQPEEGRLAVQAPTEVVLYFACAPRHVAMLLSPVAVHAQTSRLLLQNGGPVTHTSNEATAQRLSQGRTPHTRGRMLTHSRPRGSRAQHLTPARVRLRTSRRADK